MHRNNEGAIGAQAGRETRRRHANKKWAHSMHWACTQVHTPSSALGIPCNRRAAMLASWPRAAAASVAASRAAIGFACTTRAREVAEQVKFSFFFPCTGTTPSLQEGPPITSSGTSRTRTRRATCAQDRPPEDQVPPGRQRGRWRRQKLLRMCQGWAHRIPKHGSDGHPSMAASRSMAVTGTQSRRPGQGQGGLLERRRCCR